MWRSDIPKSCPTSVECSRKLKSHRRKRTLLNSVRFLRAGKMQRKKGDEAEKSQGDYIIPIELSTTMSVMMGQM